MISLKVGMSQEIIRNTRISRYVPLVLGVATLALAPELLAQEPASDASPALEEIVVTGSYIRRGDTGRSPIQMLGSEELAALAPAQTSDILRDITANTGSTLSNESGVLSGTGQFNLRGLGLSSTLALLNGRRAGIAPVADASVNDFTDINQFPMIMIDRVEILKDGASATYGSDAVAGVANIITRKGMEGLDVSARYGDGVNQSFNLGFASGKKFDGGSVNLYGAYFTQDRAGRPEFDFINDRILGGGDRSQARTTSSTGSPGSYRPVVTAADGTVSILGGGARIPDPDCEAADGILSGGRCRYDFSEQTGVLPELERIQIFTELSLEISDSVEFFAEAGFSRNEHRRDLISRSFNNGAVDGGSTFVPADHPFNFFIEDPLDPTNLIYIDPSIWDNAIHTAVDIASESRPMNFEEAKRFTTAENVRTTIYTRVVTGLNVQLKSDWEAMVSYQGAFADFSTQQPQYIADVYSQAIVDGRWNPFGTRIANPTLVSPKDGVSTAGNADAVSEDFVTVALEENETRQHVIDVIATGSAFDMPAGLVGLAVGAQYRKLEISQIPDSLDTAGEGRSSARVAPFSGASEVYSVFGEALLPATDDIELQLAVRHEAFDGDVDSTTDPKLAFKYEPLDWLLLRGSWGTSFQAPTVRQSSETTAFVTIDDPAAPGAATCGPGGATIVIFAVSRGADDLSPQSSENFNIGVGIQQGLFEFGVDYWHYDYENLIVPGESAQAVLNNDCADDGVPNDPRVLRDGSGQISRVNTEITNIGSVVTDGFDFTAGFRWDLDGLGSLDFDLAATYILAFDVEDGSTSFDAVGSRNFTNNFGAQPELRMNGAVSWFNGPHSVNATVRYIDGYDNDQSNNAPIDSQTTVDLQYAIDLDDWYGGLRLALGLINAFDEDAPGLTRYDSSGQLITGMNAFDRPGYDPLVHDVRGRTVYIDIVKSF